MTSQNSSRDDFDQLMRQWMEADSHVREPEHLLDSVLERTKGARRRPSWLLPERWVPGRLTMRLRAMPLAPILLIIALLLAAIAAIILIGSRQRLPEPFGLAANGQVVYLSNGQVFAANADGSNTVQLTFGSRSAAAPVWSRDGTKFAYKLISTSSTAEDPEQFGDLVVVDADGSNPITIERNAKGMSPGEWSPDGRWLAYSLVVGGIDQIFIAASDGSSPPTRVGNPETINWGPVFSPDGTKIAYFEDQRGVVVMNRDGSNPGMLNQTPFKEVDSFAWHPDGKRLVVSAAIGDEAFDLWFLYLDRSAEHKIVLGQRAELLPSWSPDGTRLSYLTTTDGYYFAVRVADADGKHERIVPGGNSSRVMPTWSPDGTRIAVVHDQSDVARVKILDPDGEARAIEIVGVLPSASVIAPRSGVPTWQRKALP